MSVSGSGLIKVKGKNGLEELTAELAKKYTKKGITRRIYQAINDACNHCKYEVTVWKEELPDWLKKQLEEEGKFKIDETGTSLTWSKSTHYNISWF
jgi:hypothetical protein